MFMFDEVPLPVWYTSIGNWSVNSPAMIRSAARAMASAIVGVERAEILVREGGGLLDPRERDDLGGLQRIARDGEVLHGSLRLRGVERVFGNAHLAHRVVLDAVLDVGHVVVPPSVLAWLRIRPRRRR